MERSPMDRKAIAERLRALATDQHSRSKAARLRDVFDDVEAALAAGVQRKSVLKVLAQHGMDFTLAGFDSTLRRIRRKRDAPLMRTRDAASSSSLSAKAPAIPSFSERDLPGTSALSSRPADLDAILGSQPDLAALAKLAKGRGKP
jgi:hypothetical protein